MTEEESSRLESRNYFFSKKKMYIYTTVGIQQKFKYRVFHEVTTSDKISLRDKDKDL